MNMKKPIIAVDFDDVVADFNRAFLVHHNENFGTDVAYSDITTFDLGLVYGIDDQTFVDRVVNFCRTFQETIKPIDDIQSNILELSKIYDLQIVTSRWDTLDQVTQNWVDKWFPETFSAIHFVNKHPSEKRQSKSPVCKNIGALALIDDALHNVTDAAESGLMAILMDRPWNQGQLPAGVVRVHTWTEASEWIQKNIK
ncbi:MAG: putative HAD superfamily protein [Candidatus Paceibacteria bacterium]|jgi:uncharacterized HAD superfamily protein